MRVSDECECLMMTACVRGQKSRGVFAFSFSRLRRTTAKLVRGIAPFERTAPVWNGHEVNATRRKRVRIARSRRGRGAASSGVRRDARFVGSEICASAIDARACSETLRRERHAPKSSHTSHDRRTPRMGKSPHRSHEWHSSRPCKHGSNIGSRSHGRTRSRRESGGALRADEPRACVPRPGRRERLCRDQCATAHAFIVRLRSRLGQRPRTNASKRGAVLVWANSLNHAVLVISREPAVGASRGKKSACTSASHQGTRSAARGFRPAAPGSAPFVPTRAPFAWPAGRVSSAPRASGASVGRRRPNAHRAHRRRRRPDAARRR